MKTEHAAVNELIEEMKGALRNEPARAQSSPGARRS
jgi:hypothetical protein